MPLGAEGLPWQGEAYKGDLPGGVGSLFGVGPLSQQGQGGARRAFTLLQAAALQQGKGLVSTVTSKEKEVAVRILYVERAAHFLSSGDGAKGGQLKQAGVADRVGENNLVLVQVEPLEVGPLPGQGAVGKLSGVFEGTILRPAPAGLSRIEKDRSALYG